jgi:outer membrane immunogenic protein
MVRDYTYGAHAAGSFVASCAQAAGAIAIFCAIASVASAADLPMNAKPSQMVVPVAPSWAGWYVGLNAGGVWGSTNPAVTVSPGGGYAPISGGSAIVESTESNRINNSGGLVGGQIGYLWQSGSLIGGLEAAFDWVPAYGSPAKMGGYTESGSIGETFTFNNSVSINWLFTFLGRVGVDMGGWYPYLTGGLAVAELNFSSFFDDSYFNSGRGSVSIRQVRAGPAVGGGAEWRLNSRWSLRGEYLYMEFRGLNGTMSVAQSDAPAKITSLNYNVKFKENVGRIAISYKF